MKNVIFLNHWSITLSHKHLNTKDLSWTKPSPEIHWYIFYALHIYDYYHLYSHDYTDYVNTTKSKYSKEQIIT